MQIVSRENCKTWVTQKIAYCDSALNWIHARLSWKPKLITIQELYNCNIIDEKPSDQRAQELYHKGAKNIYTVKVTAFKWPS